MAGITTDSETIRRWATDQGGKPAVVARTHGQQGVGIIRIMFPDNPQSEHEALEEISWDEFFEQFEESELALLYEEDGQFNKLVGRDTAEARAAGELQSRAIALAECRHGSMWMPRRGTVMLPQSSGE